MALIYSIDNSSTVMYSFLYYYLYKLSIKRNPDAKFAAATVVGTAQIGHFLLLNALLGHFIELPVFQFSNVYLLNKLAWMPFALLWLIGVHLYFGKKFILLEEKYSGQNILSLKNGIIVCNLIFSPFLIAIPLLSNS